MKILHTESSLGWGGQEMRILSEAKGLSARGYRFVFAVAKGARLAEMAKQEGFKIYEVRFKKIFALFAFIHLIWIIRKEKIHILNTHSSWDAWIGGIAARVCGKRVVRTRHLSTPTKGGINSVILFKILADFVVTTSSGIIPHILRQAKLSHSRCRMIATGVDPNCWKFDRQQSASFRESLGIPNESLIIGTLCVVRSWKGIEEFLLAAHLLRDVPALHWIIVGGGYLDAYKERAKQLSLHAVHFTGHLAYPQAALGAMDIFALLSTSNEGISQATIQAAYFSKPLITTSVGGLQEVCISGETGLVVSPHCAQEVANAVLLLQADPFMRKKMGERGKQFVEKQFLLHHTLTQMEEIYRILIPK